MTGVFITSSGTGIGKTYLTCALLTYDRSQRNLLTASKPIISGWPEQKLDIHQTDTALILKAQGLALSEQTIQSISPWRFRAPLSPDLAAKMEQRSIDFSDLLDNSRQQLFNAKQQHQLHLIEGVGGVMCPITADLTVLDWIKKLDCPVLLVVGSYLGTLSHTLTALHVLRSEGINIIGIVINETSNSTVSMQQIEHSLRGFTTGIPLFTLLYQPVMTSSAVAPIYNHLICQNHVPSLRAKDAKKS